MSKAHKVLPELVPIGLFECMTGQAQAATPQ